MQASLLAMTGSSILPMLRSSRTFSNKMPYSATNEIGRCDPRAITAMPPPTMWAQWFLHVVHCLVYVSLECLDILGKTLYLMPLYCIHCHSLICPPPLLLGPDSPSTTISWLVNWIEHRLWSCSVTFGHARTRMHS